MKSIHEMAEQDHQEALEEWWIEEAEKEIDKANEL